MEPISNQFEPLLLEQLREQVSNLMAATQLLTPAIREQEDRRYDQYLAILNQSSYRLLRLMNNMECVQKLDAGELVFRPAILDLAGLCREVADQTAPLAAQVGVTFRYEESCTSMLMAGDDGLLRKMLLNLISNALRAAGEGGEAGLLLAGTKDRAVLTIWDSGSGTDLPGGVADICTQKEFDDLESLLERSNGLGLGLMISRQIAALHGGAVVFERRKERGVRAVVSLVVETTCGGVLRTSHMGYDASGGFSKVLVELSSILPYKAFFQEDVE